MTEVIIICQLYDDHFGHDIHLVDKSKLSGGVLAAVEEATSDKFKSALYQMEWSDNEESIWHLQMEEAKVPYPATVTDYVTIYLE